MTLLTPRQVVQKYQFLTMGSLRWLLFNRDKNGLDRAVVKVTTKKMLVDDAIFQEWLESRREVRSAGVPHSRV